MEQESIRLKNEIAKMKRKLDLDQREYIRLKDEYEEATRKLGALEQFLPPRPERRPSSSMLYYPTTEDAGDEDPATILTHAPKAPSLKKSLKDLYLGVSAVSTDETLQAISPSLWQYVLVFPNPDHIYYSTDATITEVEAFEVFKLCFTGRWRTAPPQTMAAEMTAFREAFKLLEVGEKGGKKVYHGGRLLKVSETVYQDSLSAPKDFSTLMRNIVLSKLVLNLGISSRQILSSNGRYIYISLYAGDHVLELEAERTEFNGQFSVAMTDIRSLEPCDQLQRPFLNLEKPSYVQDVIDEVHQLASGFIDLKGVASEEEVYQPSGVTIEVWNTYRMYLYEICQGLRMCQKQGSKSYKRLFFSKLVIDSMRKVNALVPAKQQLRSLWDWLGIKKPIGAYIDYQQDFDPNTLEDRYRPLWRSYITDDAGHRSLFRNMEKLKLLYSLIGTELLLYQLTNKNILQEDFALHNEVDMEGLAPGEMQWEDPDTAEYNHWLTFLTKPLGRPGLKQAWKPSLYDFRLPLNKIRNYYGEKIALYFAFLSLLAKAAITPGLIGLVVFIIQRSVSASSTLGIAVNAIYCVFISCWATVFLEMWRRREARLALAWGMLDFTQDEQLRPQFIGQPRRSPITDELEAPHFSSKKRKLRMAAALLISLGLIMLVLSIVSGLYIMRWQLSDKLIYFGIDFAGPAASLGNAVQIQVFNIVYKHLAIRFTEAENHKTQTQYENSLVLKIFMFQFTNSFVSLYYTAFVKTYAEGCMVDEGGKKVRQQGANCFDELFTQLVILFIVAYGKNVVEIGLPYISHVQKARKIRSRATMHSKTALAAVLNDEHLRDDIEDQHSLNSYISRGIDSTYEEYMEIALMYGYLTVFAVAFPLSASMSFVSCILEIAVDRFKFVTLVKRPLPTGARTIGIWWSIFQSTTLIAIFTNAGLFCFTAPTFENTFSSEVLRFIPFALIVLVLLVFRALLKSIIPDISEKYTILTKRHQNIVRRYIRPVDEETEGVKDETERLNFKVLAVTREFEAGTATSPG